MHKCKQLLSGQERKLVTFEEDKNEKFAKLKSNNFERSLTKNQKAN